MCGEGGGRREGRVRVCCVLCCCVLLCVVVWCVVVVWLCDVVLFCVVVVVCCCVGMGAEGGTIELIAYELHPGG